MSELPNGTATKPGQVRKTSKMNWILPLVLVCLALIAFFLLPRLLDQDTPVSDAMTETTVIISVGGEEKLRIPLSKPQTVTIAQPGGEENVIVIAEDGVFMERSTCHNQICVHSGRLTPDNYDYRPDGPFIICLPNQVSVELVVFDANDP